jgi:hypothetical protein
VTAVLDEELAGWTHRDTTILAMVTARCWRDAQYRAEVFADPRAVLAAEGLRLLGGLELRAVGSVAEMDPDAGPLVRYVVLPGAPAGADVSAVAEAELIREAVSAGPMVLAPSNPGAHPDGAHPDAVGQTSWSDITAVRADAEPLLVTVVVVAF